ncbi:hypothetical protein GCM10009555_058920 [Acrocarpospora macrocephala]|uniref:Uncharacterized protein n=1 Tax=Acrocarpospora macrocephala TaxID=150177 RepID=A0A5M3WZL6_9ACTN|nr:hypothetical protein [Acrocarpospora macrocephala]GES11883.1 hypothetical protein Amac_054800 [Acrocarpospora macrocephala]
MTRDELKSLLAGEDPDAVPRVLHATLRWVTQVMAETASRDETAAIRLIRQLTDALEPVASFSAALPGLADTAFAGRTAVAAISEAQADLAQARATLAHLGQEMDRLRQVKEATLEQAAQAERLRAEVAEHQRLRQLANALPGLLAARDALTAYRLEEVEKAETELESAAGDFAVRVLPYLDDLRARTRDAIAEADQLAVTLAGLRRERREAQDRCGELAAEVETEQAGIDDASQRYQRLKDELSLLLEPRRRYAAADLAVVNALTNVSGAVPGVDLVPGVDSVRLALEKIDQDLAAVDADLARALAEHESVYDDAHRVRRLNDDREPLR